MKIQLRKSYSENFKRLVIIFFLEEIIWKASLKK